MIPSYLLLSGFPSLRSVRGAKITREANVFNRIIQKVAMLCADPYKTYDLCIKGSLVFKINLGNF